MSEYSFDSPDADLILRSSCPTRVDCPNPLPSDFRVHRSILAIASPVFRDMFSLPQSPDSSATASLPVVDMPESPSTLDLFLRLIYPVTEPPILELSTLVTVFEPAVKYEAEGVISRLRKALVSPNFLKAEPFRVYCIAARWGFEEEAKVASTHTLSINILTAPLHDDLKYCTAYDYHRLLTFHRSRSEAALALVEKEQVAPVRGGLNAQYYMDIWKRVKEVLAVVPSSEAIASSEFMAQFTKGPVYYCDNCGDTSCSANAVVFPSTLLNPLIIKINNLPSTI